MNRTLTLLASAITASASTAHAQTPLKVGDVVDRLEMIVDRTVYFEPLADGKLKIARLEDLNAHPSVPRVAGQVGVSMSYSPEIGTILEFNSGLTWAFAYTATLQIPVKDAPTPTRDVPVCSVRGDSVASEQWPQAYPMIVMSGVKRHDGPPTC